MSDKITFAEFPKDFKPSIRNISKGSWTASIRLPVVGDVTVTANAWEDAKMGLWIISESVKTKMLSAKQTKDPKDWSESEWRLTLNLMREVMSKND